MRIREVLTIAALLIMPASTAFSQENKLNDAEVAHVAVTANQIDIDYAAIAKEKSKDKDILNFAKTMSDDHTAVIKQASDLAKKLGVTPKDNDVSKKLMADAAATRKSLQAKSGKEFDKAYIENEVAYHKAVISAVKDLLIPETENSELKQLLQTVVPALEAHLHHAEMVQKSYSSR